MGNPSSILTGDGRHMEYTSDPVDPATEYLPLGRGDVDMGASHARGAHTTVLAPASTGTRTSVAGAAADTLLLAANEKRVGATILNQSTAILYVGLGTAAASSTDCTIELPGNGGSTSVYYEVPFGYTGQIRGRWATATGNARLTELACS